jgi:phosphate starvation-inducible PhoH-like protein
MRGRTLNDSFVILDEAQNTTSEQMKMFLTRLGFNSKAVITGDTTQIDLPQGKKSGLIEALEVCGKIEGIGVVQFGEKDVVRHNLVQQIIRAYEDYDVAHPQRGGNAGAGAVNSKTGAGSEETAKIPNRENQRA